MQLHNIFNKYVHMNIRKNVVLEPHDMKQLEALLEEHDGNLSATITRTIYFTSAMVECYGSIENVF